MNSTKKLRSMRLLWLCYLFAFISCNTADKKNQTEEKNNNTAADPFVKTDSAFVERYVAQKPLFKKHRDVIMKFYRDRNFRLGWIKENEVVPQANTFIDVVKKAHGEGLNPNDYKIQDITQLLTKYKDAGKDDSASYQLKQELDLALTATYMNYASDFYRGAVDWKKLDNIEWSVRKNKIKLNKALETILKERDSRYPYYQFEPLHADYDRLRTALQTYRELRKAGGWPRIEGATKLKLNDSAAVVPLLRKRLLPQDRWQVAGAKQYIFDQELADAIKKFQVHYGLKPDGALGPSTLKTMNVSLDDRIDQIIINMERWRWVPKPKRFEEKHIFVNLPEYMLYARENGKNVLNMKVVIGKTMHSTPVFSDKLEYIVFSPYWNVPASIVVNEMKPKLINDPGWLDRMDMELLNGFGKNAKPISPSSVDWASVTKENFKYLIRQRPGPDNPLGDIKFIFPNEHEVYLHHTASESLFSQTQRGFSHGCVRVEKPVEVAKFLLSDQPAWDESRILEAMHAGTEKYQNLKVKVPVYIVYFTAWVDEAGEVHFRDDIYGHDKVLEQEYFK